MDDLELNKILDGGDGPEATPEVLRHVVARHRHRQLRQYRIVATSAIVIALAGAGIGVGLNESGSTTSAAGSAASGRAPAGLKWDTNLGAAAPSADAGGVQPSASSAGGVSPEPGEFGFFSSPAAPSADSSGRDAALGAASLPTAGGTNTGGGSGVRTGTACKTGCDVLYEPATPRQLFVRHLGNVTLTASLVTYSFPLRVPNPGGVVPDGTPTPVNAASPGSSGTGSPGTSSGGTATATSGTGTSSTGTSGPATTGTGTNPTTGTVSPPIDISVPVEATCPPESELVVTIAESGDSASTETLFVPAGGSSSRPFSVVASAASRLPGGGSIVLGIARVNASVSSVSATFPSGGSDSMAPQGGWAVLGKLLSGSANLPRAGALTLVATSRPGATLERVTLPASGALATAPVVAVCRYLLQPVNAVTSPPTTRALPPTGTVQPGSVQPGSVQPGSVQPGPELPATVQPASSGT